jgi:large subunit ribosomal protein L35Ae
MKGMILSYRRGRRTHDVNQMLIELEGVDSKEKAMQYLDKTVVWKSPSGREMDGKIIGIHGNKGVVRAKFERNLPGQAIMTEVQII